jgi:hypothetical protein
MGYARKRTPSPARSYAGVWNKSENKGVDDMTLVPPTERQSMRMDKRMLQKAVAEMNREIGFEKDPTATAEKAQEMILALGIRPEENAFSSEIIRMRNEKFAQE